MWFFEEPTEDLVDGDWIAFAIPSRHLQLQVKSIDWKSEPKGIAAHESPRFVTDVGP